MPDGRSETAQLSGTTHEQITAPALGLGWEDLRREDSMILKSLAYPAVPLVILPLPWLMHAVAGWATWLYWTMVVVAVGMLLISVGVIRQEIRFHIKRRDTATQTLRAASQGRIEVIGTLRTIDGPPLISPLYGIPCVAYWSCFIAESKTKTSSAKKPDPIHVTAKQPPPAVLLGDGAAEVFVPFKDSFRVDTEVPLDQTTAPATLLRPDLQASLAAGDWTITVRREDVVPVDKPVQVNGLFRTLTSRDSYTTVVAAHTNLLPPTTEQLESDPVEQAWRTYCARREAEAGQSGPESAPVPVNAILPITHFTAYSMVRVSDAGGWATARMSFVLVLMSLPFAYLLARLMGWLEPLWPLF